MVGEAGIEPTTPGLEVRTTFEPVSYSDLPSFDLLQCLRGGERHLNI